MWIDQSTDNLVEPEKIQKLNLTEDQKRGLIEYFNLSKDANQNDPLLNEILTKLELERETVSYIQIREPGTYLCMCFSHFNVSAPNLRPNS